MSTPLPPKHWVPVNTDSDVTLEPMDKEQLDQFRICSRNVFMIQSNPILEVVVEEFSALYKHVKRLHLPGKTPARPLDPLSQVLPAHVVVCTTNDWAKWESARLPPLGDWPDPKRAADVNDTEVGPFAFRWLDTVMPIKVRWAVRSNVDWSSTMFMIECVDVAYYARDEFLHTWREFFPMNLVLSTALAKVEYLACRFPWLWYVWSVFKARHNMSVEVLRHILFQGNALEVSLTSLGRLQRDSERKRQQADWKRHLTRLTLCLGQQYQEQVQGDWQETKTGSGWWHQPRYCEEWINHPENQHKVERLWGLFMKVKAKVEGLGSDLDQPDEAKTTPHDPESLCAYSPELWIYTIAHRQDREADRIRQQPQSPSIHDEQYHLVSSIVHCNALMNLLMVQTREVMKHAVENYPYS